MGRLLLCARLDGSDPCFSQGSTETRLSHGVTSLSYNLLPMADIDQIIFELQEQRDRLELAIKALSGGSRVPGQQHRRQIRHWQMLGALVSVLWDRPPRLPDREWYEQSQCQRSNGLVSIRANSTR